MTRGWWGALALVTTVACSGGSSGSAGSGPVELPTGPGMGVLQFCELWIERHRGWCEWQASCCGALDPERTVVSCPDGPYDVEDQVAYCTHNIRNGLGVGASWDGTNAPACIEAATRGAPPTACDGAHMAALGGAPSPFQEDFFTHFPECRGILENPAGGYGTPCDWSWQCQSTLTCSTADDPGGAAYQCLPRGIEGHACDVVSPCADGLVCAYTGDPGDAGTCGPGDVGAPCRDDYSCRPELRCEGGESFDLGTCVVPGGAGAACADDDECASGFGCTAGQCVAAQGDGAACTSHRDCLGRCVSGLCASICGGAYY